jgi:hypothetical protein
LLAVMTWRHIKETTTVDDDNRTYRPVKQCGVVVRVPRWVAIVLQRCGVSMWTA